MKKSEDDAVDSCMIYGGKDLKNDIFRLMDEKSYDFSKGQKNIARYIKDNYDKAAYMTAA